ncbi:MAG: hypothetical protein ABIP48_04815 [Planctomycetota bacterium]
MRISLAKRASLLLPILVLVGCQTSGSSWYRPSFSMSKLNPFSSSADKRDGPARPAELASPTLTMPSGAGYAAASSSASGEMGYPNTASSYEAPPSSYPSTQSSYPSTSAGSLGGPQAAASPATTPQSGYYGAGPGYGLAGQSGAGTNPYGTAVSPSSESAAGGYRTAGVATPYGTGASTAPRYGTIADRYGANQAGSDQSDGSYTGQDAAAADPYQSVRDYGSGQTQTLQGPAAAYGADSRYGAAPDSRHESGAGSTGPSAAGSSYPYGTSGSTGYGASGQNPSGATTSGSRYDSGQRYGAGSDPLIGDRYARADTGSTDAACDKCSTSQPSDSGRQSDRKLGDTGYQPGGPTANMPGRTEYDWGNTGYNPPGVSPYRSPAESYTAPFFPGSTKPYTPGGEGYSEAPADSHSGSSGAPKPGSYVIPASHEPQSPAAGW